MNPLDIIKNAKDIVKFGKGVLDFSMNPVKTTVDYFGKSKETPVSGPLARTPLGVGINTVAGLPRASADVAKLWGQMAKDTGRITKDVVQYPIRALVGTGMGLGNIINEKRGTDITTEYTPSSKIGKVILGDKPVKDIASEYASFEDFINKTKTFGGPFGLAEKTKIKIGDTKVSPLLLGGFAAAKLFDFTGFGGTRKKVATVAVDTLPKAFVQFGAKTTDPTLLRTAYQSIGVDPTLIPDLVKNTVNANTEKSFSKAFIDTVNNSKKAVPKIKEAEDILLRVEKEVGDTKIRTAANEARLFLSRSDSPQVAQSMIDDFSQYLPSKQIEKVNTAKELYDIAQGEAQVIPISKINIREDEIAAAKDVSAGRKSMSKLPVLVEKQPDGTYDIIDGKHRVVQASREGNTDFLAITDEKLYRELAKKEETFYTKVSKHDRTGTEGVRQYVRPKKEVPSYVETGDLSTTILKDLEGKSTVSKTYIMDATNRGNIKQPEKDLIRKLLANEGNTVNVSNFAEKVKAELLPLKRQSSLGGESRYESVALPDDMRGNVKDYSENVYQSPIKTSAGDVHFSGEDNTNYFGHTRIEDMADNKTRRVIEVQSDLYQKGNLEKEIPSYINAEDYLSPDKMKEYTRIEKRLTDLTFADNSSSYTKEINQLKAQREALQASAKDAEQKVLNSRKQEVAKLSQYNDPTAHFRMIREEIKKTAQDGKTKLQFPTGETAMKIEGLGGQGDSPWHDVSDYVDGEEALISMRGGELTPNDLKVGQTISKVDNEIGSFDPDDRWIITDVLGDGKFKAVPKQIYETYGTSKTTSEYAKEQLQRSIESFDISGKVDTNNPIYKFYEKEMGRYLTNKYGAKVVTDKQGVKWYEVDVKPEIGQAPVDAFGVVAGFEEDEEGNLSFDPMKAAFGVAGMTAFNRGKGFMKKGVVPNDPRKTLANVEKRVGAKAVQLPPALEQKAIGIEIAKESIANNPLNALIKYASKTGDNAGKLPEVLGGKGTSGFKKKGDDIITEALGRQDVDSETVRADFEKFVAQKKAVKEAEIALKQEIKALKYSAEGIPMGIRKDLLKGQTKPISPVQSVAQTSKVPDYVGSTGEVRSLEKLAEQSTRAEIRDPQLRSYASLPKIIERTQTPVKAKVNMLDYVRTPENVLKKIGLSKQFEVVRRGYDGYLKELPKNIDKITEWSKRVPKESGARLFKYLDGQAIDLTPKELKVAGEIKVWLAEWADRLGLPQDNRIANYITHLFDDQLIKKEFDEDLAKIIAEKVPGSVYNPFLQKRLGAKGYREDVWASLDAYVKRGTRKVHMDPALQVLQDASVGLEESQWNYVKRFSDRVNMRPTEIDNIVDNGIKSIIGYRAGQRPVATITGGLRRATYRGMLGLNVGSALRNLSQGVNTYAKLGEKYTTIGYAKLFSPANLTELKEEAVLTSQFVQDRSISAVKTAMQKADKGLFAFFETAEKINRGAAYFGAKAKGLASGMSEKQAIEYGKKIVRETQFAFGSIDTPVGMSSDLVKTLTQFQTFTTKQIEFLAGMAKNKEYAGLIRYALAGVAFVYTVGQAFGMEKKDLVPILRLGIPPSLKLPYELIRAGIDAPNKYGQARDAQEKATDVAKTLPGYIPAGIQAKKTIQGLQAVQEGGSYDKAGNLQFIQGQSPAQKLQSILFGKYSSKEAQKYFNRNEISSQEKKTIQPIYDEAQKFKAAGDTESARNLVNSLSDADYEIYKKILTSEKAKQTIEAKKQILPVYNEVQRVKDTNVDAAKAIIDDLSDEEYKAYQLVKKDQAKLAAAEGGEKPKFDPNEVVSDESVVETVLAYAKAIGTDPVTAFKRIFAGEKIRYVANGVIVVQRLSLAASQAEKEAQGSKGSEVKLDHTLPLQLGGTNDKDNLKLVPTALWQSYTDVENALGEALRDKKIDKKTAQSTILEFKNGDITAQQVYELLK